jgi:hypothetical protein
MLVGEEVTISCEMELIKANKDALTMNLEQPEKEKALL